MAPKMMVSFFLLALLKLLDRIQSTHQFYYSEFRNYYLNFLFSLKTKMFFLREKKKHAWKKNHPLCIFLRLLILFNLVWKSIWAAEMQIVFTYDTI